MTRREALRLMQQEAALLAVGFTPDEAESLRRISVRLHHWHEKECGIDSACIVRGRLEGCEFTYYDDGAPYWEHAGASGRNRYTRTPDLERGAMRRLKAIMARVNAERAQTFTTPRPRGGPAPLEPLGYYIQGDPRGAALYILRPGDVPEGGDPGSYYSRGICVA